MRARRQLAGRLGLAAVCLVLLAPGPAQASFGIESFTVAALNEDGTVDLQAGSHPYEYTVSFAMNHVGEHPEGALRDLVVDLPPGLVGNPLALPRCSGADFEGFIPHCPGNTQIGIAHILLPALDFVSPVYNLTPPLGVPVSVGLSINNNNSFQEASLRPSDYGARISDITLPTDKEILSVRETIWGVPALGAKAGEGHFDQRQCFLSQTEAIFGCASDVAPAPFLTLPTSCAGPLQTTLSVDSLQEPEVFQQATFESLGEGGAPEGLSGCNKLLFNPKISAQPETSTADSPSGLHFDLQIPQNDDPQGIATAHLKNTVVTLPAGMVVNPSSAGGLGACPLQGPEGINLPGSKEPAAGEPAKCPANSKVGTVQVKTPLLDHPVSGTVYLAKQGENPFGSLIALYVAINDPISGVVVKLAGKVEPDPLTGQLKATFLDNPQLPFEDFRFDFSGGPRATLTTPPTCPTTNTGTLIPHTTTADLTPWTSPEAPDVSLSSSFFITTSPGGGPCAPSEAQMPNKPSFEAGTAEPLSGAFSPFVLELTRENGSQRFGALNMTLPPGVSAKLAGVTECSEAQIAQAQSRSNPGEGAQEMANPACPQSSQLGVVDVGAGSGSPLFVQGSVYLAGPYKGAPLSLAIITPAVAGPFDLGTVVVRAALYVNETTAQVTVKSDPIPAILQGIPLDVRDVRVQVNRPDFTLNPTSCDEKTVSGETISTTGALAPLSDRFQVGGCNGLDYAPKLSLRFKGASHRRAHPKVIATLTAKPGEANTAFAQVKLPKAAFLDNAHIGTVCTRPAYAAEACPAGSVYGRAEAITPLLDYPLKGDVYLRSNPAHKLPDLVIGFRGPPSQPIKFDLAGKTDSVKGALRNTFEYAPDVPVSKFRLELFGGKRGLVELSSGLCAHPTASIKLRAHSGKQYETNPKVKADCGGKSKKKTKHKRRR